jgi:hypothetical protein
LVRLAEDPVPNASNVLVHLYSGACNRLHTNLNALPMARLPARLLKYAREFPQWPEQQQQQKRARSEDEEEDEEASQPPQKRARVGPDERLEKFKEDYYKKMDLFVEQLQKHADGLQQTMQLYETEHQERLTREHRMNDLLESLSRPSVTGKERLVLAEEYYRLAKANSTSSDMVEKRELCTRHLAACRAALRAFEGAQPSSEQRMRHRSGSLTAVEEGQSQQQEKD